MPSQPIVAHEKTLARNNAESGSRPPRKRPYWNTARLKRRGFDKSYFNREHGTYKVRCSQCEALAINGVPCHEQGCPNSN